MEYIVKGDCLDCYGWEAEEKLVILQDKTKEFDLPENVYLALNVDRRENAIVLESQITKNKNLKILFKTNF